MHLEYFYNRSDLQSYIIYYLNKFSLIIPNIFESINCTNLPIYSIGKDNSIQFNCTLDIMNNNDTYKCLTKIVPLNNQLLYY